METKICSNCLLIDSKSFLILILAKTNLSFRSIKKSDRPKFFLDRGSNPNRSNLNLDKLFCKKKSFAPLHWENVDAKNSQLIFFESVQSVNVSLTFSAYLLIGHACCFNQYRSIWKKLSCHCTDNQLLGALLCNQYNNETITPTALNHFVAIQNTTYEVMVGEGER